MTDSDKQALINNTCTVPTKIIVDNGDETTTILTENDYVLDWQQEDFRFVPNEGFIGQFVERIVTGNLKNVDDSFSITDKEIEVQFGIQQILPNITLLKNMGGKSVSGLTIRTDTSDYTSEQLLDGITQSIPFAVWEYASNSMMAIFYGSDMDISQFSMLYPNGQPFDKTFYDDHWYLIVARENENLLYILNDLTLNEWYGDYDISEETQGTFQVIQAYPTSVLWNCMKIISPPEEIINWYSLGHFIVSNPSDDNVKDKTSFKAIDHTKYFEKPFENTLTYPTTLGCLAYACCEQSNTELGDFTATLTQDVEIDINKKYFRYNPETKIYNYVSEPTVEDISSYYELTFGFNNSDFIIDANQFINNESCREVMKCVGKTAFSWVRIDWDDKCYLDYEKVDIVDEYDEIDNDHYYDLTSTGSVFGELNTIVVGMKDIDGENVTITDPDTINPDTSELDIWDNPLTYTQEKREEVISAGEQLYGLKYQDVELTTTGHPWLKGKEKIKIKDMENNYIYTYPFDRTISYMGHIKTKIKAPVISSINTQYNYEGNVKNILRNTQIQVDKANQQITTLVTETIPEMNDKLIGTVSTQDLESFKFEVNQTIDNNNTQIQEQLDELSTPQELKNTLVEINVNGIQVSTNLSKISTMMTNDTFLIQDSGGTKLAYFGYDETLGRSVSQMDNLTVTNYFTAGCHRQEEIKGEGRTGWFYIGGV